MLILLSLQYGTMHGLKRLFSHNIRGRVIFKVNLNLIRPTILLE